MKQSFRDLAKEDWQKKKLDYEALIRTDSYLRLVDKAITKWAKAKNKAFAEWAKTENIDLNKCKLATAREQFFAEPNLEADLLANKLKIPYLFTPDKELPEVAVSRKAVRSIRRQGPNFVVEEATSDPGVKLRPLGSKPSPTPKREYVPLKPFKKDGRYILIEIDLHASKERILAEMELTIKVLKFLTKTKSPTRGDAFISKNNLCPFEIYDRYEAGRSLIKITWELCPKFDGVNPNYDPDVKKAYMKIRRLHEKAKKLIKEAEESCLKLLKQHC